LDLVEGIVDTQQLAKLFNRQVIAEDRMPIAEEDLPAAEDKMYSDLAFRFHPFGFVVEVQKPEHQTGLVRGIS